MLTEAIQLLLRVIGILGEILGITQTIQSLLTVGQLAQDAANAAASSKDVELKVNDSVIGLAALQAQLATFQATTALDFTALSTQIAAFSPAGNYVQIQQIDVGDISVGAFDLIAEYVWVYQGTTTAQPAIDLLEDTSVPRIHLDTYNNQVPFYQLAGWQFIGSTNIDNSPAPAGLVPTLDFTTVISSDANAVDWLNRVAGGTSVVDGGGGAPLVSDDNGNSWWVPWLQTPMFEILRDRQLGISSSSSAPIWPGVSGVTLGTSVALATGLTITGPLSGVLIALTSVPTTAAFFDFNGDISYRNLGALTFQSDNGDDELPQGLGFTSALYLPKTMQSAGAVLIRTVGGVVGTATPFTIP